MLEKTTIFSFKFFKHRSFLRYPLLFASLFHLGCLFDWERTWPERHEDARISQGSKDAAPDASPKDARPYDLFFFPDSRAATINLTTSCGIDLKGSSLLWSGQDSVTLHRLTPKLKGLALNIYLKGKRGTIQISSKQFLDQTLILQLVDGEKGITYSNWSMEDPDPVKGTLIVAHFDEDKQMADIHFREVTLQGELRVVEPGGESEDQIVYCTIDGWFKTVE